MDDTTHPTLRQVVLDTVDPRGLAEFYRRLLGWSYRPGDEPQAGRADEPDWLVLTAPGGGAGLAFQQVDTLPRTTWPGGDVPQQAHLDTTVPDLAALAAVHDRALALGATERLDRTADPEEPLWVFADPAGHLFCVFVAGEPA